MNENGYDFAKLNDTQLNKLKDFESKTGTCIVALKPKLEPAKLSDTELNEMMALEKDLDITLVAYKYTS